MQSTHIGSLYVIWTLIGYGGNEDAMVLVRERTITIIFLPNKIFVVRKFLFDTQVEKQVLGPTLGILNK
jgi:hypothetical protein